MTTLQYRADIYIYIYKEKERVKIKDYQRQASTHRTISYKTDFF